MFIAHLAAPARAAPAARDCRRLWELHMECAGSPAGPGAPVDASALARVRTAACCSARQRAPVHARSSTARASSSARAQRAGEGLQPLHAARPGPVAPARTSARASCSAAVLLRAQSGVRALCVAAGGWRACSRRRAASAPARGGADALCYARVADGTRLLEPQARVLVWLASVRHVRARVGRGAWRGRGAKVRVRRRAARARFL